MKGKTGRIDTTLQLRTNMLLYCCSAVLALGRLVNPVIAAMLADSVTERERAVCFPVLQSMVQAGPLVGYFIGYYVLHLHLSDYKPYWELMAGTQVFIVIFIRMLLTETLSDANAATAAKANEDGADSFSPKRGYRTVKGGDSGTDSDTEEMTNMAVGKTAEVKTAGAIPNSRRLSRKNKALSCSAILRHYTNGIALFKSDRVLLGLAVITFFS